MTHLVMNAKFGFARVNSILGSSAVHSPCPYVWDDSAVVLMNADFDEVSFRFDKLRELFDRGLSLSFDQIEAVFDAVVHRETQLMLRISFALPQDREALNHEFDTLLDEAIAYAEHQQSLKISKENIIKSRPLIDGWMSYDDVSTMVQLAQKRRFSTPEKGKFVNRSRH